ncbi:hypothetical protein SDC9_209376 [bioreactor metagenome]|uniref:Uncharacterized protein n=1 Tax=bioreactor metagenome TaxID=1076179 RepID=A0A645JD61_9ZZZZ
MIELAFQHNAHQLFGRRTHVLKPLPERNHGKAVIFQRLDHHGGVPAIIGDFPDVVPLA